MVIINNLKVVNILIVRKYDSEGIYCTYEKIVLGIDGYTDVKDGDIVNALKEKDFLNIAVRECGDVFKVNYTIENKPYSFHTSYTAEIVAIKSLEISGQYYDLKPVGDYKEYF